MTTPIEIFDAKGVPSALKRDLYSDVPGECVTIQQRVTEIVGVIITSLAIATTLAALFYSEGAIIFLGADIIHNLVHLATGIIGIIAGWNGGKYAGAYCKTIGAAYLALFVSALLFPGYAEMFIDAHPFDMSLHLIVGLTLTYTGFICTRCAVESPLKKKI